MITLLITLSLEKEILILFLFLKKILDPKICTNPAQAWKIVVVWLKLAMKVVKMG